MWECGNGDVEGESQIVFNTDRTNTYKKTVKDVFFFRLNIPYIYTALRLIWSGPFLSGLFGPWSN